MQEYQGWELLDIMPDGWSFDKTAGTPLHGYSFATNGKSVLNGQLRALVRVIHPQTELDIPQPSSPIQAIEAPKAPSIAPIDYPARTVNELARQKFKVKLLADIMIDLMVCELEGWDKMEYLNELKAMINEIGITT